MLEGFNESQFGEELANELHCVREYVDQCRRQAEDAWVTRLAGEAEEIDGEKIVQILAEQSFSAEEQPESSPSPNSQRVILRGQDEGPVVLGKIKPKLTMPQYNVVKALLDAGDVGLTKDELVDNSGHEDARGILKRLRQRDDDWKQVIHFAGTTGRRYRIK